MINGWTIVRFVHVLSAAIWVGGLLVFTVIVSPMARRDADIGEGQSTDLLARIGKRVGVIIIAVLLPVQIFTGIALLAHRHISGAALLSSSYGRILFLKLMLVALVVIVAGIHGYASASGHKSLSRVLAIATLVVSVLILGLATALAP